VPLAGKSIGIAYERVNKLDELYNGYSISIIWVLDNVLY
jgi:hypothetical protein